MTEHDLIGVPGPASPRGRGTERVARSPLWHGTAFFVEALVLLAFLLAAGALFTQLFAAAQGAGAEGAALSEAVLMAQNAAEELAAADDPASLAGSRPLTGSQTGDAYTLAVEVEGEPHRTGTLWHAHISVTDDTEAGEELYALDTAVWRADDTEGEVA